MLAGAHKQFERVQHAEMYLLTLTAQDNTTIKLSQDTVQYVFSHPLSARLHGRLTVLNCMRPNNKYPVATIS